MLLWNQTQVSKYSKFITLLKWIAFNTDIKSISVKLPSPMRKLGAMPRMKVFLVTPLYLFLSCRYNVPSVVFLCLPALLAQPLWGAAAFCWQNVLQGVWCGRLFVAWTYSFLRCACFSRCENIWIVTSKITTGVEIMVSHHFNFYIRFCVDAVGS